MKIATFVFSAVVMFSLMGCRNVSDTGDIELNVETQDGAHEPAGHEGYALSVNEKALFELWYYALQVKGIENDLRLWYTVDAERRNQHVPAKEIERLEVVATELAALDVPDALNKTYESLRATVAGLKEMAGHMPFEDEDQLDALAESYWETYRAFPEAFYADAERYVKFPEVTGHTFSLQEELNLIEDADDRASFEQAVEALVAKQYEEAASLLKPLLEKYRNHPAEGSILMRYVDAHVVYDSPFSRSEDSFGMESQMVELLDDYLERCPYSVVLYHIYWQWRTLTQLQYGSSNWSEINNWEYNLMWRRVAHRLMEKLEKHPDDQWAKFNLLYLQYKLGIIERFTSHSLYGNTNIIEWARLNGMLDAWAEMEESEDE